MRPLPSVQQYNSNTMARWFHSPIKTNSNPVKQNQFSRSSCFFKIDFYKTSFFFFSFLRSQWKVAHLAGWSAWHCWFSAPSVFPSQPSSVRDTTATFFSWWSCSSAAMTPRGRRQLEQRTPPSQPTSNSSARVEIMRHSPVTQGSPRQKTKGRKFCETISKVVLVGRVGERERARAKYLKLKGDTWESINIVFNELERKTPRTKERWQWFTWLYL